MTQTVAGTSTFIETMKKERDKLLSSLKSEPKLIKMQSEIERLKERSDAARSTGSGYTAEAVKSHHEWSEKCQEFDALGSEVKTSKERLRTIETLLSAEEKTNELRRNVLHLEQKLADALTRQKKVDGILAKLRDETGKEEAKLQAETKAYAANQLEGLLAGKAEPENNKSIIALKAKLDCQMATVEAASEMALAVSAEVNQIRTELSETKRSWTFARRDLAELRYLEVAAECTPIFAAYLAAERACGRGYSTNDVVIRIQSEAITLAGDKLHNELLVEQTS